VIALILTCRDEAQVLGIAMGEPVDAALLEHIEGCSASRARVEQFGAEVASLVGSWAERMTSPSTEADPAVDHAGKPSSSETTLDSASERAEIIASAVAAGWHDAHQMETDDNLKPLRSREEFQALIRKAGG
jgi:hypothetical protein